MYRAICHGPILSYLFNCIFLKAAFLALNDVQATLIFEKYTLFFVGFFYLFVHAGYPNKGWINSRTRLAS